MSEQPKTPPPSGLAVKISPGATPSKQKAQENVNKTGPTICLHVPLTNSEGIAPNVVIDFMKLAEDTYGYEVIHPDIRSVLDLANDADDNEDDDDNEDIDLMADGTNTSQATPGSTTPIGPVTLGPPTVNANNNTSGPDKPKSRGKVEGKYDLNDPFIDDSEMLWEEQAASTKDGFFVFLGPLVQAGEQPQIERADGTIKKRSKGDSSKAAGKGKGTGRGKRKEPVAKKAKVEKESNDTKEKPAKVKRATKKEAIDDISAKSSDKAGHVLIAPKPKEEKQQSKGSRKKADKNESKTEGVGEKTDDSKSTATTSKNDTLPKNGSVSNENVSEDSSNVDAMKGVELTKTSSSTSKVMSINGLLSL